MFGQYRAIPGQAKLLIILSFVPGLAVSFIYTDLSYFLTQVQGLSIFLTSIVISAMAITTVATSIPFGILADRFGRRKFIIIGNLLASVTLAFFALTTNPLLLLIAAVTEGSAEAAFASAGTAFLAEKSGDSNRTPAFALQSFLSNIAWGLSGFSIPLVLVFESFGYNVLQSHVVLYLVLAGLSAGVTPILILVGESKTSVKAKSIREFMPRKSRGVIVRYSISAILIASGAGLFVPLMSAWFSYAFGVPDTASGPIIGVSGFLIAVFTLGAPNLARRFGLVKSIVLTQGLSMVFMVAVPLAPTFALAGGIYIIRTFIMNVAGPLSTSLIMGLVAEEERGAASGISAAIWRFPNGISTLVGGAMMKAGLLALPFYIASILYAISTSLFWSFFRKSRTPEETPRLGETVVSESP